MAHIFVICGHGAGDSGAVNHSGATEAERVRRLGKRILELGGAENVTLADTSRNWYADCGLMKANIPADWQIVELHMDAANGSARGGHVVIKAGIGGADVYDKALADGIASIFPGRSNKLVERNDLANPNRAARRRLAYRLVENGFIDNDADLAVFDARLDDIARTYLKAFGIGASASAPKADSTPAPAPAPAKKQFADIRAFQAAIGAAQDNIWGQDTEKRWKAVKYAARYFGRKFPYGVKYTQGVVGTKQDGIWGTNSIACHDKTVAAIQRVVGAEVDCLYGPDTDAKTVALRAAADLRV